MTSAPAGRPATFNHSHYTEKRPERCPYCTSKKLIKKGVRRKKLETVQLWRCNKCNRSFTPGPAPLNSKTYPLRIILEAITSYSLGYSLLETAGRIKSHFGMRVAPSTISNWLAEQSELIAYQRFRDEGKKLFSPTKIVRHVKLHHRQVYGFSYHRAKLALLSESAPHAYLRQLAAFLESVPTACPHDLFQESAARASQARADFIDQTHLVVNQRENLATRTAALVIPTVADNRLRHESLQSFMLANDSATVAVEIPIWLHENDIAALEAQHHITLVPNAAGSERVVTGHIDFIQIRHSGIYILDYKPDARTNQPLAQLTIYALALTRLVPDLHLFDITCAWFNENEYNEFFPRTVFRKE